MARLHDLKTVQPFYDDVISGRKPFEVRFNDRNYQAGEQARLLEYDAENERFTGYGSPIFKITYVLDDPMFCKEGFVILGISPQGELKSCKIARTSRQIIITRRPQTE